MRGFSSKPILPVLLAIVHMIQRGQVVDREALLAPQAGS
jgi:hypothetical protein